MFAPLNQALISAFGWVTAMLAMAATALLTLPLAAAARSTGHPTSRARVRNRRGAARRQRGFGLRQQLRIAARDKSYWCLHAGFFTCGFHIAFLVTHLPGEVALCGLSAGVAATSLALIGLANIAGSLTPVRWATCTG